MVIYCYYYYISSIFELLCPTVYLFLFVTGSFTYFCVCV